MIHSAHRIVGTAATALALSFTSLLHAADGKRYRDLIMADKPAAYWRFDSIEECCTSSETDERLRANAGDKVSLIEAGPRPPVFPNFAEENTAAAQFYRGGLTVI